MERFGDKVAVVANYAYGVANGAWLAWHGIFYTRIKAVGGILWVLV